MFVARPCFPRVFAMNSAQRSKIGLNNNIKRRFISDGECSIDRVIAGIFVISNSPEQTALLSFWSGLPPHEASALAKGPSITRLTAIWPPLSARLPDGCHRDFFTNALRDRAKILTVKIGPHITRCGALMSQERPFGNFRKFELCDFRERVAVDDLEHLALPAHGSGRG